ncbi:MAG TPA: nuclear transport factor 2 family protein [Longimicrobiaceae bacterium]
MNDSIVIQDLVTRMLFAVDALDWAGARATFADELHVDYTSLFGGSPERLRADELIARWQGLLPGFAATQHLTGPIVVTSSGPGEAVAETQVRGYHYVDGDPGGTWIAAGRYTIPVRRYGEGWRITGIRLDQIRQEGNLHLPTIAAEAVQAGHAARGQAIGSETAR